MKELTLQMLKDMEPGIFATGTVSDNPVGVNMANTGRLLRWVAVRGQIHDWKIYCHLAEFNEGYIKAHGDKIHDRDNIKKLVPCTAEALEWYRD